MSSDDKWLEVPQGKGSCLSSPLLCPQSPEHKRCSKNSGRMNDAWRDERYKMRSFSSADRTL